MGTTQKTKNPAEAGFFVQIGLKSYLILASL